MVCDRRTNDRPAGRPRGGPGRDDRHSIRPRAFPTDRIPHPGVMKSRSGGGAAFIAVSLRAFPGEHRVSFPPLAKGGPGGVARAEAITESSKGPITCPVAPLKPRCQGWESHSRCPRRPPPPPLAPPSQGGERDRSAAPSFDRAQQKHPSPNRRSSAVNTNFSSPHPHAPRSFPPGGPKNTGPFPDPGLLGHDGSPEFRKKSPRGR